MTAVPRVKNRKETQKTREAVPRVKKSAAGQTGKADTLLLS